MREENGNIVYRTGIGWDVHAVDPDGGKLMLGGVHLADAGIGLRGHSDADVVCHAICDALLGAASLGDIGDHFPDTDAKWQDFPGVRFLELVREKIVESYDIVNVDCVVMSDVVRLGKRKREMANTIAHHLSIDPEDVGVKATTWEGHGAVGRGEVIACQAVALIRKWVDR